MKIALIIPPSPWLISDTDIVFLGPLYLSAYLKKRGHDVTVIDLTGQDLNDWWPKENYNVWGLTGSSPNFPQIREIANRIRLKDSKAKIIAGGVHATMAPEHMLLHSAVDTCVLGPGEKRLDNLLSFGFSDGIYWKDKGEIKRSFRDPKSENYDLEPVPDYEAIDFKKYLPSKTFRYILGECNEATVLTTLGCPYRCAFCAQHNMRPKVKYLPIGHVAKNVDYLIDKYNVKLFYMMDDTFGIGYERLEQLCNMFRYKSLSWHCLLRSDLATKEKLSYMKECGCLGVVYGFESGSDTMLGYMNKKTTAKKNYDAAKLTHDLGMAVRGQIVVGFPGETDQTVEETRKFIQESPVTVWGIHTFQPFPGSDVWNNPEKYGVEIDKDTDFSDWHTIGKANEIKGSDKVRKWISILKEAAGNKNIEKVAE